VRATLRTRATAADDRRGPMLFATDDPFPAIAWTI